MFLTISRTLPKVFVQPSNEGRTTDNICRQTSQFPSRSRSSSSSSSSFSHCRPREMTWQPSKRNDNLPNKPPPPFRHERSSSGSRLVQAHHFIRLNPHVHAPIHPSIHAYITLVNDNDNDNNNNNNNNNNNSRQQQSWLCPSSLVEDLNTPHLLPRDRLAPFPLVYSSQLYSTLPYLHTLSVHTTIYTAYSPPLFPLGHWLATRS